MTREKCYDIIKEALGEHAYLDIFKPTHNFLSIEVEPSVFSFLWFTGLEKLSQYFETDKIGIRTKTVDGNEAIVLELFDTNLNQANR